MHQIEVTDLTYKYSVGTPFEMTALDNVSFTVEKGDFVGLIGHTGSGKSTLFQCLNGLLKPESGKVCIDGVDISDKKLAKGICFKVGLVFQYPEHQLFEETVRKDISFGPKNLGLSDGEIADRVNMAMKFCNLDDDILDKSPFELSGGQKRRVAIAGVISMKPDILILDEPAAGLDPKGKKMLLDNLRAYHDVDGKTVILSSHNMDDIAKYCQKAIVMNNGKIDMTGTVDEIFSYSDRLTEIGLDIPMMCKIFNSLKKEGYSFDGNIYTVENAFSSIMGKLEGGVGK